MVDAKERKAMLRKIGARAGEDRRIKDKGPPNGWAERRKAVERRLPEVSEVPFSEWLEHRPVKELIEQR